ncbi:MAG: alpha/beta hydrolase [Flavobacteriales bacterium]|nr:alpha/beta hydrolase [Flavobacteriales bacterium]
MKSDFTYNELKIAYVQYGTGTETSICFPGFGRPSEDFKFLQPILKPNQRLICVDLFAHGESIFPATRIMNDPLSKEEWIHFMNAFLLHLKLNTFHLIGYSMGGRVVLVTMELMYDRIISVLLIAPDGLKINPFYRFASGTAIGRKMYHSIIQNPTRIFALAKWLNKVGLLTDKLHRFVHVHLDTREKRELVRDAWMIYRKIFPDKKRIASLYKSNPISFHMIFGKFDSVIVPQLGQKFAAQLGDKKTLHVLPMGHRMLGVELQNYLNDNPSMLSPQII